MASTLNGAGEDGEDDYLSMTFDNVPSSGKETSLQRTARLKREAAERGRILSKAERAERERDARETALSTQLDSSNKGAQMLAKMGFKGGTLGRSDDARTEPILLQTKDGRGGVGMDSDRKRKIREAAAATMEGEKRLKVGVDEFRARSKNEREERRAEGQMWGAMKVLESCEMEGSGKECGGGDVEEGGDAEHVAKRSNSAKHLRDVNVLYRSLVKQRLEREREQKMRYELNNSMSSRNDEYEDKTETFDSRADEVGEEDEELDEFEALSFAERRDRVVTELRSKFYYCFWCKHQYEDEGMDGCPGLTEDEHG